MDELKTQQEANDYRAEVSRDVWEDDSIKSVPAPEEVAEEVAEEVIEEVPVDPAVQAMLDKLESRLKGIDEISYRVKQTESRIGSLQNAVHNQMQMAKKAADEVKNAPSKEEIVAATKDDDKWDELKEAYSEWAEIMDGMDERLAAKSAKAPDIEAIKKSIREELDTNFDAKLNKQQKAFEVRLTTFAHKDWPEIVKSPEWEQFINNADYVTQQRSLSDNADDAIYVLDKFKESRNTKKQTPDDIEQARKNRLRSAQTVRTNNKTEKTNKSEADMTDEEYRAHIAAKVWDGT